MYVHCIPHVKCLLFAYLKRPQLRPGVEKSGNFQWVGGIAVIKLSSKNIEKTKFVGWAELRWFTGILPFLCILI